jgi:ABC-2 type transport system permease protein
MKHLLLIAAGEWRYWVRSYLALSGTALFMVLLIATSLLTGMQSKEQGKEREHHQSEAESTFLAQPDRHPHRMVHYGHYVFRTPAPLALFDPGLDPVIGQSIFLEGHRQNSAMFADSGSSANFGGLSWLTPAMVYQLFGPLLVILLGHGAIVREREAGTLAHLLAQGINGRSLIAGKALALLCFIALLLVPFLFSAVFALSNGEQVLSVISLVGVYLLYLSMWGLMTLFVSSILQKRSTILATLTALWLVLILVFPAIAVSIAERAVPLSGKIETDLIMQEDIRKLGDGHKPNDPAFKQLRANILKQYDVEKIEDLPVNFRGLVAMNAEKKLTDVLNDYANSRMAGETQQAQRLSDYGWLSPRLAIANASRAISGTDLEHYHRFLREAEELRFDFVQGLNNNHAEKLTYQDDMNRNRDDASGLKARIDATSWEVLDVFDFQPASAVSRLNNASQPIMMLIIWFVLLLAMLLWSGRRLQP